MLPGSPAGVQYERLPTGEAATCVLCASESARHDTLRVSCSLNEGFHVEPGVISRILTIINQTTA